MHVLVKGTPVVKKRKRENEKDQDSNPLPSDWKAGNLIVERHSKMTFASSVIGNIAEFHSNRTVFKLGNSVKLVRFGSKRLSYRRSTYMKIAFAKQMHLSLHDSKLTIHCSIATRMVDLLFKH